MKINIQNTIKSFFVIFFLFNIVGIIAVAALPQNANAKILEYNTNVDIKDFKDGPVGEVNPLDSTKMSVDILPRYIKALYKYAASIVGILATVVLMYGGFTWITSGGSAERVGEAKAWIASALSGLILMMFSYTILYIINPGLVEFKPLEIKIIAVKEGGSICCNHQTGDFFPNEEDGSCQANQTCNDYCGSLGRTWGDSCGGDGFCYKGVCEFDIGKKDEPCGKAPDGTGNKCMPSNLIGRCPEGFYAGLDGGFAGRDCGSDLACCH